MTKRTRIYVISITTLIFSIPVCPAQGPRADQPDIEINGKEKAQVVDSLVQKLREEYVFPDVADKVAQTLTERLARGEYGSITSAKEFSGLITRQMREIARDAHLHVSYVYAPPPGPVPSKPGQPPAPPRLMLPLMKAGNYGFEEAKILDGNVGYLKVNAFTDNQNGRETAASAMAFVAHTDALVIDLRRCMGGSPDMVGLLASYLFPANRRVHLNDISFRKPGTTDHTIQQWWTLPHVPGKRYIDNEVYILTSHRTPSAAEEFAYDLKTLKRATIVGERTWGGANPGEFARLTDHFLAFIPRGQAINPVTKTNWEGTGVEPDINVSEADALKTAHATALQHLIKKTSDLQQLSYLKEALGSAQAESPNATQR